MNSENANQIELEKTILRNLLTDDDYMRKVLPFIKADYFDVKEERIIFDDMSYLSYQDCSYLTKK